MEAQSDIEFRQLCSLRVIIKVILDVPGCKECGYWSNEFGGNLLFVDELFVKPESRNRGIGRNFFEYINTERPFAGVVCALEVAPNNDRARRLYASLGFEPRSYTMMIRRN